MRDGYGTAVHGERDAGITWTPIVDQEPNDADLCIDPSGRVGIGVLGYSAAGTVRPDTWHRLAFVADFALGTARWYVDGRLVFTGSAALDGGHSLYSNVDPDLDLLLFNEGDTAGVHTHSFYRIVAR
ncbi:MAG TPA: hypothetical protein PKM43_08755 [Verrucomicrobiota bacterium]|nr:hypothetical protein [Verrucomicrobiota bacterium]